MPPGWPKSLACILRTVGTARAIINRGRQPRPRPFHSLLLGRPTPDEAAALYGRVVSVGRKPAIAAAGSEYRGAPRERRGRRVASGGGKLLLLLLRRRPRQRQHRGHGRAGRE